MIQISEDDAVSIPYGTIKSAEDAGEYVRRVSFNSIWYD